jgi:hypothetical protein
LPTLDKDEDLFINLMMSQFGTIGMTQIKSADQMPGNFGLPLIGHMIEAIAQQLK